MPDRLCLNRSCPLAGSCHRAQAQPSPYAQVWTRFEPEPVDLPSARHWHCAGWMPRLAAKEGRAAAKAMDAAS